MKLVRDFPIVVCQIDDEMTVLHASFKRSTKVDLKVAEEIVANRLEMMGGKPHFIIVDISNVREVTAEAKEHLQNPDAGLKNIKGAAFIAGNPVSALIANIFIKTPKHFPSRFFSNSADALMWIKTLEQVNNANGIVC